MCFEFQKNTSFLIKNERSIEHVKKKKLDADRLLRDIPSETSQSKRKEKRETI